MGQDNLGWSESIVKKMPKKVKFSYISSLTDSSIPMFLHPVFLQKSLEKIAFLFLQHAFP